MGGGTGVPPNSANLFLAKWFSAKGVGGEGATPLAEKILQVVFDKLPKHYT